jgi:hypothetical protein
VSSDHATVANQTGQRLLEQGKIQASLSISQPDDPAEREAERVAEQVMRMSAAESPVDPGVAEGINRKGTSGQTVVLGEAEKQIQSVTAGGKSLSPATRSYFETRFGRDFGDVRVHTGPQADRAARSINAEAFTQGSDVVFKTGSYTPNSRRGRMLLAHELTHVVQQDSNGSAPAAPDYTGGRTKTSKNDPDVSVRIESSVSGEPTVQRQPESAESQTANRTKPPERQSTQVDKSASGLPKLGKGGPGKELDSTKGIRNKLANLKRDKLLKERIKIYNGMIYEEVEKIAQKYFGKNAIENMKKAFAEVVGRWQKKISDIHGRKVKEQKASVALLADLSAVFFGEFGLIGGLVGEVYKFALKKLPSFPELGKISSLMKNQLLSFQDKAASETLLSDEKLGDNMKDVIDRINDIIAFQVPTDQFATLAIQPAPSGIKQHLDIKIPRQADFEKIFSNSILLRRTIANAAEPFLNDEEQNILLSKGKVKRVQIGILQQEAEKSAARRTEAERGVTKISFASGLFGTGGWVVHHLTASGPPQESVMGRPLGEQRVTGGKGITKQPISGGSTYKTTSGGPPRFSTLKKAYQVATAEGSVLKGPGMATKLMFSRPVGALVKVGVPNSSGIYVQDQSLLRTVLEAVNLPADEEFVRASARVNQELRQFGFFSGLFEIINQGGLKQIFIGYMPDERPRGAIGGRGRIDVLVDDSERSIGTDAYKKLRDEAISIAWNQGWTTPG